MALSSEKRKAKWLWPQRREDRGVFRRWVAHVGTENSGTVKTRRWRQLGQRWRGHDADGAVGQRPKDLYSGGYSTNLIQ
jgi:hypothetical protein